jgi:hypothetical protein
VAAKLALALVAFLILIPVLFGAAAQGLLDALFGAGGSATVPSTSATADIPVTYLALYRQAATTCPGLDWSILAAIGKVETDHGRSTLPGVHSGHNGAGAEGVMQFEPATFTVYDQPIPPGGVTPPSPYDPVDAIYAAGRMLCANGVRRGDVSAAVFAYNHSTAYVQQVLAQAHAYATMPVPVPGSCNDVQATSTAALAAIVFACEQLGQPYVWGGNGPSDGGFDCSGLTTAAYTAAGITLPRTADAQFRTGPRLTAGQPLLPGDLVFYGTAAHIHHVGLYLGGGMMIDAPDFGQVVRVEPFRTAHDDFFGATRPAEAGSV